MEGRIPQSNQGRPDLTCMNGEYAKLGKVGRQGAACARHPEISPRIECPAPVPSPWTASWMTAMSKAPRQRGFGGTEAEGEIEAAAGGEIDCSDWSSVLVVRPAR